MQVLLVHMFTNFTGLYLLTDPWRLLHQVCTAQICHHREHMSQGVYHSSNMMWVVIHSWNHHSISHRPSKNFCSFWNSRANGQLRLSCAHTLLTEGITRGAIGRRGWKVIDAKRSSRGQKMGTVMRTTGWGVVIGLILTMGRWGMVVRTMTRRSKVLEVRTDRRMQECWEVLMMMTRRRKWCWWFRGSENWLQVVWNFLCSFISSHCSHSLTTALVQWAKKLIDKGSNSACGSNYSPRNKGKFVGNFGNKARYPVLCCAK